MIIFGSRMSHLKSGQLTEATCPSCNTKGKIVVSVLGRYAHIFWIPVFHLGKKAYCQCMHCKYTMEEREIEGNIVAPFWQFRNSVKTPFWQFIGITIIGGVFLLFTVMGIIGDSENDAYIEEPLQGDVYKYKINRREYSTMKVVEVTRDSVFVQLNKYSTNKIVKVRTIDVDSCYLKVDIAYSKKEIKEKYNSGKIYGISRN